MRVAVGVRVRLVKQLDRLAVQPDFLGVEIGVGRQPGLRHAPFLGQLEQHVFVRDDQRRIAAARPGVASRHGLVAADAIVVDVGVDDEPDGPRRQPPYRGAQRLALSRRTACRRRPRRRCPGRTPGLAPAWSPARPAPPCCRSAPTSMKTLSRSGSTWISAARGPAPRPVGRGAHGAAVVSKERGGSRVNRDSHRRAQYESANSASSTSVTAADPSAVRPRVSRPRSSESRRRRR